MSSPPRTVTDSLKDFGSIIARKSSSILSPETWEELYEIIRRILGYSRLHDCYASSQALLAALNRAEAIASFEALCRGISGRRVCVVGGSADAEKNIVALSDCDAIIAADGAAKLAVSYGFTPYAIVGDADGAPELIVRLSSNGTYVVLHFHGDNYPLAYYLAMLGSNLLLTVQCRPYPPYTIILPGFTDGERALSLALLCAAREAVVIGMNTKGLVGWWSKPWLKGNVSVWPEKSVKLAIAEYIFTALRRAAESKGVRIVWL